MSRTDKTRPHDVKVTEHPVAVHDHRNGVCELLTDPHRLYDRHERHGCYISADYWRPEFGCGRSCKHCWGWSAKAEDRRSRQSAKREARNWQREYA